MQAAERGARTPRPGNPRQRDTEARVQKAKHLFTPVEDHRVVKIAVLPDGNRVKIDGHTRALFWQLYPERAPRSVLVVVFYVKDLAEALLLYDACDNQAALETSTDKIYGSFRQMEFKPVSGFMAMGRLAAALRFAYRIETHRADPGDIHALVEHWLPELQYLDGLALNAAYFNTAVLAATLITLRRYRAVSGRDRGGEFSGLLEESGKPRNPGGRPSDRGPQVRDFWERYNRNEGSKTARAMDAVEALRRLVEARRHKHQQKATLLYTVSRAVSCVERHLSKRGYQLGTKGGTAIKAIDLGDYFPRAADTKPDNPPPAEKPPADI